MPLITGTIESVLQKEITSAFGPLTNHSIVILTKEGVEVILQKNTKPGNSLRLEEGDVITASYEVTTNGKFTNNKVTQINKGTELQELKKFTPHGGHTAPTASVSVVESTKAAPTATKSTYDPNGARNGMLLKAGLDLAIARKNLTPTDIRLAVSELVKIAEALEKGTLEEIVTKTYTGDSGSVTYVSSLGGGSGGYAGSGSIAGGGTITKTTKTKQHVEKQEYSTSNELANDEDPFE